MKGKPAKMVMANGASYSDPNGCEPTISNPDDTACSRAKDVLEGSPLAVLLYWRKQGIEWRDLAQVQRITLLDGLYKLFGQVNEAFLGQALNFDWAPDAPANQRRFNTYVAYTASVIKLTQLACEMGKLIDEMLGGTNKKISS